VRGNHSRTVFLDTPLHVDAVTDWSKLPWHKYLKRLVQKQPSSQPTCLTFSSYGQRKFVAGLCRCSRRGVNKPGLCLTTGFKI